MSRFDNRMSEQAAQTSETALTPGERSRLVTVARRFYLDDRSKIEIANELGCSRFKVARMLEQARALGVVTITLHDHGTIDPDLSARLAAHLGLRDAIVVETEGGEVEARQRVGTAAAELLGATLRPGEVLGLAWGRTLNAMTESMPSLPRVSVVQLTGAVGSNLDESPVEIVRKVALNSGGSAQPIFAPLVVDDAATATALRRQPDVAQALRMFDDVTTAVVSVGSWDPPNSQLRTTMNAADREELLARGVRAEIAAILLGADGSLVAPDFAQRCISITADQLSRIPRVIGVAGGAVKAAAVLAVARASLFTEVVTDRQLAEAVLAGPAVEALPARPATRRSPT